MTNVRTQPSNYLDKHPDKVWWWLRQKCDRLSVNENKCRPMKDDGHSTILKAYPEQAQVS
jgi:hypothetical protein